MFCNNEYIFRTSVLTFTTSHYRDSPGFAPYTEDDRLLDPRDEEMCALSTY